ncbi:hypothetical protein PN419_00580 [Halorubrum ezzemoulense]|uniref:hypothetical protein n=1 Tax=Halorubrum ezzemoulense TaxID=337243 RepID=UPI00232C4619|nr:hypothetical protein [Halorubrum ezzemoulense]MDB9247503.1 hypothetical protein [Halorubrum ezzemoulense]MDB9258588.1 hypothetical protein [Halorubrum ezzemoulense]MDB9264553.1 hypothetical protein [Halorubrum ezzemoulense]MDB9268949.1 hypothetical protein [Halorubrum ezzemoulense]MDB9271521.1 hypothetical protein [Halorubrum ezzemoulense]
MSRAYENAVPADDGGDEGDFGPIDLADAYDSSAGKWDHDESPLRWLFGKEGRAKLVEYAMRAAEEGDPIYLNKSDLGDEADVSRHSAHRHIDDLIALGIFTERAREGSVTRYRPNTDSRVLRALYTADTEIREYVST